MCRKPSADRSTRGCCASSPLAALVATGLVGGLDVSIGVIALLLVESGTHQHLLGALGTAGGVMEVLFGVDAERRSLEDVAEPLSEVDGETPLDDARWSRRAESLSPA